MKIQPDCIPCLMKRVLFQSRLDSGYDDFGSVTSALRALADSTERDRKSVDIATEVHRCSYDSLGHDDPYAELKVRADDVAGRFMDAASRMVSESDDPLKAALTVSVIGNIMDFGSGVAIDDPSEFESMFDELVLQGIGSDDTELLREALSAEGPVVYIFDNCGESQLDRILIRHLRGTGKRVVGVVRGAPILNDVTESDAIRSGLSGDLDRMLDTGKFYIGIDWDDLPPELESEIAGSCLIIAKGMANYESLSDETIPVPIAHVLRAKCIPVAKSLGVDVGTNVVRVITPKKVIV